MYLGIILYYVKTNLDYFWLHILKAPPPCQSISNNDCNDNKADSNKNTIYRF